ncbi:MAG: DUF2076 family protein [Acetobacteraceae bacterium]|nr:DUF2076 family protein [Acetobacteraceae bacterium]
MTQEERDLIARFIARVGGSPQAGSFIGGGSVPQAQPALPPIDREADQFIGEQMQKYPEARYRITQMAVVQEAALTEMNNRLQRLQWELEQARQQQQQAPQQQARSGGLFGGLFGGGQQQRPPQQGPWGSAGGAQGGYGQPQYAPPPPAYPSQYQPGMFNRGGSGFLGSALTTAAGVAGGMVVGNALMNAFSGHHGIGEAMAAEPGAGGFLGGADSGTTAFDGAGVDPSGDFTSGFGNDQGGFGGGFGGGGFDQASNDGGGFDGGGFDSGGGFDGGGFDNS